MVDFSPNPPHDFPSMLDDAWICSETGEAFSHCIHCSLPLEETAVQWLVNKEYQGDECVLEYAICSRCRDEITRELSDESRAEVRRFLETEIDWPARLSAFMMMSDTRERFENCVKCDAPRTGLAGFGVSSLFDSGGELTVGPLPLMVCDACIRQMTSRLSECSRQVWARFLAEHFDGPPGDVDFMGPL